VVVKMGADLVFVIVGVIIVALAAAGFGTDSRDGQDWRRHHRI
jgi:hypothetical protein